MSKLFGNVGGKIKVLSYVMFFILAIGAIISGIALMINGYGGLKAMGFGIMAGGPFVAWILCWFLYGIGQLLDDVHEIRDRQGNIEAAVMNQKSYSSSSNPKNGYSGAQPAKRFDSDALPKL